MGLQASGRLKVTVTLTGDDRFVHSGFIIDEVWIVITVKAPRSNAVWYRGVDFYSGKAAKGRMPVVALPAEVRLALLDAARALPERLP